MEPRTLVPNARAAVSTAVCTLLAVAAHRTMAGADIPIAAIVLGAAAVFCFARIAAALGERGLGTIGLLVGGSQAGLHLLFEASQGSAGRVSASPMGAMTGMPDLPGMSGMPGMSSVAPMASMSAMPHASHMPISTPGMTIAHVLAALTAAWWLRRGEAALFTAVGRARTVLGASWRMLARWIAGARPAACSTGPVSRTVGHNAHKPAAMRVLSFTVIRRGPPAQDWLFSG